jgi:hypothetical protein
VTAHGSPGGLLQFDRLEAALAAKLHSGVIPRSPHKEYLCRSGYICLDFAILIDP